MPHGPAVAFQMAMTVLIGILAFLMGSVLGLLGGGGSILTLPIFVYVVGLETGDAIAASLVVVGTTAAVSALLRARKGHLRIKTGLSFGAVAMVGAYGGGRLSGFFPGWFLLSLFAGLMVMTSVLMLRGKKDTPTTSDAEPVNIWRISAQGFFVGSLTGLVGAGGGFLVVPALVLLGGLPMHQAVGTSLLVIAMNSGSGVLGHLSHANVPWVLTISVTAIAIVGSLLGASLSSRMPAAMLRKVFAWFVLVMGLFILSKELASFVGGPIPATLIAAALFVAALAVQLRTTLAQRNTADAHAR